ncbi:hypothetical protein [Azospirillum picis]|uniref:Uncharacterized protein n=1 Tax=Azospirillum picis TaxID=488438 RepID=A0ABU0MIR3_9PROT|nr:hypothetical protein [Azospirillum picis]MBP2299169.1 hypothetical protein [Azospirillum picis]MDQ0533193.1 hypothetical protein [Azospirillum picis]
MAKKDGVNGKGGQFTGTPADRLVRLWRNNDERFGALLDELLDGNRQGVIEAAIGKLREEESYDFVDEVEAFSETVQGTDEQGDPILSTLFWLAAEVEGQLDAPPTVDAIERALDDAGLLENASDLKLLPLWLDVDRLSYLEAADRRSFVRRFVASTEEAESFAREQDLLADATETGSRIVAVVGLVVEEDVAADGEATPDPLNLGFPAEEEPELDPIEQERIRQTLAALAAAVSAADARVRRLEPVGGLNDLLDFTAEGVWPDDLDANFDEINDFLDIAGNETGDGVLDATVEATAEGVQVRLYNSDGVLLDERSFDVDADRIDEAEALLKRRCRRVSTV